MMREQLIGLDFSRWKKKALKAFLPEYELHFASSSSTAKRPARKLLWGAGPAMTESCLHVEDGFLRSVGLGADLVRPVSWVFDSRGIYYDATRPSDLEHLLAHEAFTEELLERARKLRTQLVDLGITKYNVGSAHWRRPTTASNVVLVIGQVESDASLALGSPELRSNLALLKRVREHHPDAYIVYKPHPDVLAGMRALGAGEDRAASYCDEVLTGIDLAVLFTEVDEIHVLTSLSGFEALLRGCRVVCHGLPFYAGWGLTEDRLSNPRRQRKLSLEELVAGSLILYPRYLSRYSDALISPEMALEELQRWKASARQTNLWGRLALSLRRMVLRKVVGVR